MTYFSARLPVLYPTDAEALFTALEDHNVPYALLDGTKDVWVRDFMPVRTRSGRMLSFRYEPSYLAGAPELRTDFRRDMALQLTPDLKVKALSSGMAAKLKIAATLSRNAEVCMLDEPLNGIDLIGRDQIIQSILRAANPNATILISSHLFDELEPIVDHIVMMANGSLVLEGELEEIRTRYGKSISDLYREYFSGVSQPAFSQNPPANPTV